MRNYDEWRLASPYDYQSDDPRDYGFTHEDDLPCFDETRWYISRAYKAIQENNLKELTECLGELGHQFDCELKNTENNHER